MSTVAPSAPAAAPVAAPAPSTPAPSSPAPAAPAPSSSPTPSDPLEALRSEMIQIGHRGYPQDSSSAPTEPAPGSTPEGTVPVQTAEGSTPPSDSQPAPTAPQASKYDDWIKRYGGTEKAAEEAFALEQRAAAMAREIKELKGQPPATPASPTAPTTAAAQPAAAAPSTPAPSATAPVPAHPAPADGPALTIQEQAVTYALANDADCRALITQFNTNQETLKALTTTEIPALQDEIRKADILIAHPSVDELVKDEARQNKERAESRLASREARAAQLDWSIQTIGLKFDSRIGEYASRLQEQAAMKAREADDDRDAGQKADEFVKHWPAAFETEFSAQGIDPEMRADIHDAVKVLALARPNRIQLTELGPFMKEAVKAEFVKVDKYHRIQARAHALRKNADTSPVVPTGPAATATEVPAPPSTDDILTALRNETRQALRARRGA